MAKAEDTPEASRANGIEMRCDTEDLRPTMGDEGIVDGEGDWMVSPMQRKKALEQEAAKLVGRPCSAREEAM